MEKLNKYAWNLTSQHGEDGIIQYLASVLEEDLVKVCCEFGAWDGIAMANTYNLWHNDGWEGILIEADSKLFQDLQRNIQGFNVHAYEQFVQPTGSDSLDALFQREALPFEIGLLSIDIDSCDYYIWKHLERLRPQVVIIEFNQGIPPHIEYVDPEDSVYLRCSAKALEALGQEKGYRLVCCTRTNCIFVNASLCDKHGIASYPVEYLFDYSELAPALVRLYADGNKYPVWVGRQRRVLKALTKFYYWLSSSLKSGQRWEAPPNAEVKVQMEKAGLDF